MSVLAFDTALGACSVAFWRDGAVLAGRCETMQRGQAERLLPMIEAVRREAGLSWDAVTRLCVTTGPGTFAGVRIGVAAARALALARALPCVGLTTHEALVAGRPGGQACLTVVDVRRGAFAVQPFDADGRPEADWSLRLPAELSELLRSPRLLLGPGAAALAEALPASQPVPSVLDSQPDARLFAALAGAREPLPGPALRPVYARPPDARLPDPRSPGERR